MNIYIYTYIYIFIYSRKRKQHHEVSQHVMAEQTDDGAMVDASDMPLEGGATVPSAAVDAAAANADDVIKEAEEEAAAAEAPQAPHERTALGSVP